MFELFSEIVRSVPPTAVRHIVGRIHGTIEDALLYKEIEENWDVQSVLSFCQFMDSVFEEDVIFPLDRLPARHIAFYGKLVTDLIEAGELPAAAREKFDAVFSAGKGKRQPALLT